MYLKDRVIENIIVVDDYISALILGKLGKVAGSGYLDRDSMASYMNYLHDHTDMEIVRYFDTPEEKCAFASNFIRNCPSGRANDGCKDDLGTRRVTMRRHGIRICGRI